MKALVTGATGFLGKSLVEQLLGSGASVRCFVRLGSNIEGIRALATNEAGERLEIFTGSLGRPADCNRAISGCDTVFHLAAEMRGAVPVLVSANVIGTRHLLEAASVAAVERFVLVSSLAVYDTSRLPSGAVLDESCPLDPEPHRRDGYTFSKVLQEQAAWQAHQQGKLPLVVIRPGVIFGPGRDCLTGRMGLRLGRFFVQMDGRQQLPYTYVHNCAAAVVRAGREPGVVGQAFNIVDDGLWTGRQLWAAYRREIPGIRMARIPRWAIMPLSRLCESYHVRSRGQLPAVLTPYKSAAMWKGLIYTNSKARQLLRWHPEFAFPEAVKVTISCLANERRQLQVPA